MKEYLEVYKNNELETEKVLIWLKDCVSEIKPAVVIYYDGDYAFIAANVTHLLNNEEEGVRFDPVLANQKFLSLAISNPTGYLDYWNHNNMYFTFHGVPKYDAQEVATKIAGILMDSLKCSLN